MKRHGASFWLAVGLAAYVGVVVAGVQTARQSAERRALFQRLTASQEVEDANLREYRMLLLERATVAGYQNIEPIARDVLGMRFPNEVVRVEAVPLVANAK